MSQDIQSLLPELKRLISMATPGPWYHCQPFQVLPKIRTVHGTVPAQRVDFVSTDAGPAHRKIIAPMEGRESAMRSCDMAYIAAANPATLSALIAHIEALERELEGARASMEELAKRVFHDQNQQLREGDQFAVPRLLMILCETCGNKRCPHANDKANACTGSNEPGQPGSAYP